MGGGNSFQAAGCHQTFFPNFVLVRDIGNKVNDIPLICKFPFGGVVLVNVQWPLNRRKACCWRAKC